MRASDIIRKKRDSGELTREEIDFIVHGATHDTIPDYQLAAWLMAVFLHGMGPAETAALTESMLHFGEVVVTNRVMGYRRKRLFSDDVLEVVDLDLPEQTFETEAFWFTVPMEQMRTFVQEGGDLAGSIHAIEHAAIGMISCARWLPARSHISPLSRATRLPADRSESSLCCRNCYREGPSHEPMAKSR